MPRALVRSGRDRAPLAGLMATSTIPSLGEFGQQSSRLSQVRRVESSVTLLMTGAATLGLCSRRSRKRRHAAEDRTNA